MAGKGPAHRSLWIAVPHYRQTTLLPNTMPSNAGTTVPAGHRLLFLAFTRHAYAGDPSG